MKPQIVKFGPEPVEPSIDFPRPDRRVTGNPKRLTSNVYTSPDGQVSSGEWRCEVGAWRIEYPQNLTEVFHLLAGEIHLTDTAGQTTVVKPGESCVIPPGFCGTFDVRAPARKVYVIIETP